MSHSYVFIFLLVIAGISTVHSQKSKRPKYKPCQGRVTTRTRSNWGGRCFGTQDTLYYGRRPIESCDAIIYNNTISGCPMNEVTDTPMACCVNCGKQDGWCNRRYAGSQGMDKHCNKCPDMLRVRNGIPNSGCYCCKKCVPKKGCRKRGYHKYSRCITQEDPVYNPEWCHGKHPGGVVGKIIRRKCKGNGCWCCQIPDE